LEQVQDDDDAEQQADEQGAIRRECACRGGRLLLLGERTRQRQHRNHIGEAPENIARPSVVLNQGVLPLSPAKPSRVRVGRREGVENLGEPCGPALPRLSSADFTMTDAAEKPAR